ncbi:MAG TPA: GntR family transcriptional regulator [Terrimicrobiaceae bacterium]|nr:GntR family transcriptional regulator [Terrimicrobiaceae bacterium]
MNSGAATPAGTTGAEKSADDRQTPLIAGAVEKICAELAEDRYQVGEKLPTFREWSKKYQVSLYAAQRAMQLLKQEGIISSREGSYTYLARKPGQPAPARKPSAAVRIVIRKGESRDLRKVQQDMLRSRFHRIFMDEHPGTEIVVESCGGSPGQKMLQVFHDWQERTGPSFANFATSYLDFFDEHHLSTLVSPEDFPGAAGEKFGAYCGRLLPRVREACLRRSEEPGRAPRYGLIPDAITLPVLTCFRPVFQQCGLDATRAPRDWEELLAAARRIKERTSMPALHFPSTMELVWWYFHLEAQAVPIEGAPPNETIFQPGVSGTQAVDFLCRFHQEGLLRVNDSNIAEFHSQCLTGKVPMVVSTQTTPSVFYHLGDAGLFCVGSLPHGPNRKVSGFFNVGGNVLRAGLSPEEMSAAVQYLIGWERFSRACQSRKAVQQTGLTPAIIQPWADQAVNDKIPADWQDALHGALEGSLPEAQGSDMRKFALCQFFNDRFLGGAVDSPEALLHLIRLELSENGLWR